MYAIAQHLFAIPNQLRGLMEIRIASVMVENQDHALRFYTTVAGFVKNKDIPMGPTFRWLTVTAPEGADGVELLLEPMAFPPAQAFQKRYSTLEFRPRRSSPRTLPLNISA